MDIVKPSAGDKPSDYSLNQNYPNPFNPTTTISYSIKSAGDVTLKVYDMLGTEVANLVNERQEAGNYSIEFNAAELPSGIYVYRLASGNFMETKKLVLLK
ncbi:MAG: T9SS C-terminal target domain-containing protein [Chlorobiota bacterium]|nr:MAG: T9SS C-terminal target domain-containing protein [Chlorobiota bacterium]